MFLLGVPRMPDGSGMYLGNATILSGGCTKPFTSNMTLSPVWIKSPSRARIKNQPWFVCNMLQLFVLFYITFNKPFFEPHTQGALTMAHCDKAKHISKCLEMAILFEVSANKPGNVNFVVGFEGTRVEHFLASAVAASPSFEEAAKRGIAVAEGKLKIDERRYGQLIKDCVADIDAWQSGGNTLLGTVMLFIPLGCGCWHDAHQRERRLRHCQTSGKHEAGC